MSNFLAVDACYPKVRICTSNLQNMRPRDRTTRLEQTLDNKMK